MTRGALSFITQSFLFSAFVRGVLVLQPHGVDGSEGTRERGSEGARERRKRFLFGWRANRSTVAVTLELETRCKIATCVAVWHANWMRFNLGWSLASGERPSRYRTLVSPIKRGCEADVGAVRVIHWSVLCRMAAQVRLVSNH